MSDSEAIEKAGEELFDAVYVPAFLKQCASNGIEFKTEDDVVTALNNVLMLKTAEANKVGRLDNGNMHKDANDALQRMFGQDPVAASKKVADQTKVASLVQSLNLTEEAKKAVATLADLK